MKRVVFSIIVILLFFYSCKETETVSPEDKIPAFPSAITPSAGDTIPPSYIFSWNASETAFFYNLQISVSDSFTTFAFDANVGNVTSKLITGLTNNTQYYWRVNATNTKGTSNWSTVNNFFVGALPATPTLISPVQNAVNQPTTITLTWNKSDMALSYLLMVSRNSAYTDLVFNQNIGDVLQQQISGLLNYKQFYWRVQAINNYGVSNFSGRIFKTESGACPGIPTVIFEGKTYNTVQIGNQCWLKENLNVGTRINSSTYQTKNTIIEKYCYDDNEAYCDTFGGLYQWEEALQERITNQGICPPGWHIPQMGEFDTLINRSLNGWRGLMVSVDGTTINNETGFSGLFGGKGGIYGSSSINNTGYWWTSTENSWTEATYLQMSSFSWGIYSNNKIAAFSIRCVKD